MKAVLLGTNGFMPTDLAQTACVMLPEAGIVFDAGSGFYRIAEYLQTPSLNIYLSHAHMDHTVGVTYLSPMLLRKGYKDAQARGEDPAIEDLLAPADAYAQRVTIHSTAGILEGLYKQYGKWSDVQYNALESEQTLPDGGVLTYFPVKHTAECIGFRIDWQGHSIAYVTDTVTDPELPFVERLRGVDVLILDSYLPDRWKEFAAQTGHGHTSGAAQVAARAQVGRLILFHHNPLTDAIHGAELATAQAIFPETEVGLDRMEIEF